MVVSTGSMYDSYEKYKRGWVQNDKYESVFRRKCNCGNIHNWKIVRCKFGFYVDAICGTCGKSYESQKAE